MRRARATRFDAIIFDKDGTLLDFNATWAIWTRDFLRDLANDDYHAAELGRAVGFDVGSASFAKDSPVIAGTSQQSVAALLPLLPRWTRNGLIDHLGSASAQAIAVPMQGLSETILKLSAMKYPLCIATNDAEAVARQHFDSLQLADYFAHIVGFDSGYTAKPAPDMLLALAARMKLKPRRCIMVGDTKHDLDAARSAGMFGIGVLSGFSQRHDLEGRADLLLPSVVDLPSWLADD